MNYNSYSVKKKNDSVIKIVIFVIMEIVDILNFLTCVELLDN